MNTSMWGRFPIAPFLLLALLPCLANAQPCINPQAKVSIVASDNASGRDTLWFGYDPLATCGIDSAICGEAGEYPPPPPTGVFFTHWAPWRCDKHPWFDYVAYRGPTAVDTHRVRWETSPGIFHWDPDSIRAICDSALFIDEFGGFLIRVRMHIDSGVTIWNVALSSALIIRFGARPLLSADSKGTVPEEFRLDQNYPNPFNPSTTIYYSVAHPTPVRLLVVNLLGQQVATLAEGYRDIGRYSVPWDASRLPGGAYFYRLFAGNSVLTKKCLLLK